MMTPSVCIVTRNSHKAEICDWLSAQGAAGVLVVVVGGKQSKRQTRGETQKDVPSTTAASATTREVTSSSHATPSTAADALEEASPSLVIPNDESGGGGGGGGGATSSLHLEARSVNARIWSSKAEFISYALSTWCGHQEASAPHGLDTPLPSSHLMATATLSRAPVGLFVDDTLEEIAEEQLCSLENLHRVLFGRE